jgi:hypothetical protein
METISQKSILDSFNQEQQQAIKDIVETLKPLIDNIHSSQPTTKYYYGEYLSVLARFPKQKKLIFLAMLYSGCNPDGLKHAIDLV